MSNMHVPRSFDVGDLTDPATMVPTMPASIRPTALKILSGAGLFALSFWLTLQAMEYFRSQWEPIDSNIILTFGDASASTVAFSKDARFKFPGINGYVEIQNTNGLQCQKFNCSFSLALTFASTQSDPQLIIGQSVYGEIGWHLLWTGGRLLLQTDGGANALAAPFAPKPGRRYKIDIVRDELEVKLSVDDVVLAKSNTLPFTDLPRNVTIGGRSGPVILPLSGVISDVQIARYRPQQ
jgi:hypothetical protein